MVRWEQWVHKPKCQVLVNTQLCKFHFEQNRCLRPDECTFAHDLESLRYGPGPTDYPVRGTPLTERFKRAVHLLGPRAPQWARDAVVSERVSGRHNVSQVRYPLTAEPRHLKPPPWVKADAEDNAGPPLGSGWVRAGQSSSSSQAPAPPGSASSSAPAPKMEEGGPRARIKEGEETLEEYGRRTSNLPTVVPPQAQVPLAERTGEVLPAVTKLQPPRDEAPNVEHQAPAAIISPPPQDQGRVEPKSPGLDEEPCPRAAVSAAPGSAAVAKAAARPAPPPLPSNSPLPQTVRRHQPETSKLEQGPLRTAAGRPLTPERTACPLTPPTAPAHHNDGDPGDAAVSLRPGVPILGDDGGRRPPAPMAIMAIKPPTPKAKSPPLFRPAASAGSAHGHDISPTSRQLQQPQASGEAASPTKKPGAEVQAKAPVQPARAGSEAAGPGAGPTEPNVALDAAGDSAGLDAGDSGASLQPQPAAAARPALPPEDAVPVPQLDSPPHRGHKSKANKCTRSDRVAATLSWLGGNAGDNAGPEQGPV